MLSCDLIREKSGASIFGNNIFSLMEVDSTNTFILNMARSGAPEGTIVVADYQNSGRGKQERKWFAPSGQNLTFSVLLRPKVKIEEAQKITLAMASTMADTIEELFKINKWPVIDVKVKWPNDLLIAGNKVCGILSESVLKNTDIVALAIGIGLNLNTTIKDFPKELKNTACSLIDFSEEKIIPEEVIALFLGRLESDYERWERNNYSSVVKQWKLRSDQIGKRIKVSSPTGEEEAYFTEVDQAGYLVYTTLDGKQKKLTSGEIECY